MLEPYMDALSYAFAEHPSWWILLAAWTGACLASFGGVLVDRLPHSAGWRIAPRPGTSLLTPSRCDGCGERVRPLALVPVLGWLLHRGRCPNCGARVPWAYPAAEAATAAVSAYAAWRLGPTAEGVAALCVVWTCAVLAWMDWREAWLPERFTVPLLLSGLLLSPFAPDPMDRIQGLALAAGSISVALLWLSWRMDQNLFTGGDVMLIAAGGAWIGMEAVVPFLLWTSGLYIATHAGLRLAGIRWEPPEAAMREEMGDGAFVPMGPAIAAALVLALLGPF